MYQAPVNSQLSVNKNHDSFSTPLLILGSAYCGKSEYAMRLLDPLQPALVIGTAATTEQEFKERIEALKLLRPSTWNTIENIENLNETLEKNAALYPQILVDSLNQYLAGILIRHLNQYSIEQIENILHQEIQLLTKTIAKIASPGRRLIFVSSELASGLSPKSKVARVFREATALCNKLLAATVPSVILVTAGIPNVIKKS